MFGEIDLCETPGTPSDQGVPICSIPIAVQLLLRSGYIRWTQTVEVNSGIEGTPVINQKLDIVTLIDIKGWTRILSVHGNDPPDNAGNGSIRPCQSDREKHCRSCRKLTET